MSRLPRFKRSRNIPKIRLTARDGKILQLVHRNRFLSSSHLINLLGGSSQHLLRRFQLLYHHGYLERPRAQIEYYRPGGSRHMVYGLGNKGVGLLNEQYGLSVRKIPWGEKNQSVRQLFFQHAVLVSEVMVSLELACREREGVQFLSGDSLPLPQGIKRDQPLKWSVRVNRQLKLGVIPDRVFGLDIEDPDGEVNRAFYFLEVDRGTMPVIRKKLIQSSFYRKLVAYEATWVNGLHRSKFGFHRFRVITITTNSSRVDSMIEACSNLKSGHGLFLFTDQATLKKHGNILTLPFKTGRSGGTSTLLP